MRVELWREFQATIPEVEEFYRYPYNIIKKAETLLGDLQKAKETKQNDTCYTAFDVLSLRNRRGKGIPLAWMEFLIKFSIEDVRFSGGPSFFIKKLYNLRGKGLITTGEIYQLLGQQTWSGMSPFTAFVIHWETKEEDIRQLIELFPEETRESQLLHLVRQRIYHGHLNYQERLFLPPEKRNLFGALFPDVYYPLYRGNWVSTVKIFLTYITSPIKKLELLAEAISDVPSLNASDKKKFAEVVEEDLLPLLLSIDYEEEIDNPINSTTVDMLRQKNVFEILDHVIRRQLADKDLEKYVKAANAPGNLFYALVHYDLKARKIESGETPLLKLLLKRLPKQSFLKKVASNPHYIEMTDLLKADIESKQDVIRREKLAPSPLDWLLTVIPRNEWNGESSPVVSTLLSNLFEKNEDEEIKEEERVTTPFYNPAYNLLSLSDQHGQTVLGYWAKHEPNNLILKLRTLKDKKHLSATEIYHLLQQQTKEGKTPFSILTCCHPHLFSGLIGPLRLSAEQLLRLVRLSTYSRSEEGSGHNLFDQLLVADRSGKQLVTIIDKILPYFDNNPIKKIELLAEIFRTYSSHPPKALTELYKEHLWPLLVSEENLYDVPFAVLAILRKRSAKAVLKEVITDKRKNDKLTDHDIQKGNDSSSLLGAVVNFDRDGGKSLL
ncbi:CbuK_2014 family Dot/Icm T4SS effector [Coxiella burnetii]|uniref:CbuK_2014 family Dot/Icm T4SS effector n=1 Tax=Coxiella burnetii TaxID=777 RepID=UPI001EDD215E|nr:CbuK_2014 family Dot/Icm T4SS effector [Coxiella burnetii]UYK69635.1 CbuK_2014 family Dot/Icm T4SS effector [Coxiella burnetii]